MELCYSPENIKIFHAKNALQDKNMYFTVALFVLTLYPFLFEVQFQFGIKKKVRLVLSVKYSLSLAPGLTPSFDLNLET